MDLYLIITRTPKTQKLENNPLQNAKGLVQTLNQRRKMTGK